MQDEQNRFWLETLRFGSLEKLRTLAQERVSPELLRSSLFVCVEQWGCNLEKVAYLASLGADLQAKNTEGEGLFEVCSRGATSAAEMQSCLELKALLQS
jgi:hypothetical protein